MCFRELIRSFSHNFCQRTFKTSALDLWKEEENRTGLVTFCKDLDLALGSGISEGMITELCGPPGSGKTQLCLQLSVNVQIPQQLGGLQGRAVYLDTKYGFCPKRVQEMAKALHQHCTNIALLHKQNPDEILAGFSEATALDGILYAHVTNCTQILEAIAVLQNRLYDGEKIKLIIIDSLSFLVRNTITHSMKRVRRLHEILTPLHKIAHRFGCVVIVTNDVTTRISDSKPIEPMVTKPQIVSALGGSHTHKINQRIFLGRDETDYDSQSDHQPSYVASISKGHFLPCIAVPFRIEAAGIRGIKKRDMR
ncbi:DNA repair protein RAD51 homolog 3-like [Anopheles maculipalpis]|uniref:DNA repair protein RAD51 homolog 3-like n=1 Tax=Anopheles maculipalpis TaxID=1496333 RepID=UPI00215957A8|nr:DNA repair protein RAD51 homolog 3-like [Anopheles maculipalpis]